MIRFALITDMHHRSAVEEQRVLNQAGINLKIAHCITEEDVVREGSGCSALLVSYAPITRSVLVALPEVSTVVKYGIGVDNIDVQACTELRRVVANVPDASSEEVAIHALSLLLAGLRSINLFAREARNGRWLEDPEPLLPYRVSRIRLGLVGFGRIAKLLAGYALPLFEAVDVYDPFADDEAIRSVGCCRVASPSELFAACRAVSVHVPLNSETKGLIDAKCLDRSTRCVLVNTSRAGVIDKEALVAALDHERVMFFGSDVFWGEPPDFTDPLVHMFLARENVIVTPHVGWCSQPAERDLRRLAAQEVVRALAGRRVRNVVNPDVYEAQ